MTGQHQTCRFCGDQRPAEEVQALADETGLATYECTCGHRLYVRYAWLDTRRAPTPAPTKREPYRKKGKP